MHRKLPKLVELINTIKIMCDAGEKANEQLYLDAYDLVRMNINNATTALDILELIDSFMAFRDEPPTEFATCLWKGILVGAGLVATRYVDDGPYLREHLNFIYLLLRINVQSESDFTNIENFFAKIALLSEPSDTRWLAANIEVRFSLVGKRNYREEIKIAFSLANTARSSHPLLYLQTCLLIGFISIEYGYHADAFIYGQQALILANIQGHTQYERSALALMSNLAINLRAQILFDKIVWYWNDIRPEDGDTDHQDAVLYSIIWRKYYYEGDFQFAEECARFAIEVFERRQYFLNISKMLASLAMVLVKQGRYREAIQHSHQAFLIAHHNHYPIPTVSARHIEGWAMLKDQAFDDALNTLILSLSMALQLTPSNQKHKFLLNILDDLASTYNSIAPPQRDIQTEEFVLDLIPVIFKAIQAIEAQNLEVELLEEIN